MSTVLFGSDGVVKLADFGLGKLLDRNQIFTRSLVGVSESLWGSESPSVLHFADVDFGYL
jgi:hypothetical protein